MPSITCSSPGRRVSRSNRAASIVSMLMLIRFKPGVAERLRDGGQQDAVGGQPDILEARDRHQLLDQRRQVAADQRLAAGQPNLVDSQRHGDAGNPLDLLEAQQGGPRLKPHLLGHAIDAADVAAVGHADPQVVVGPSPRVDE